MPVDLEAHEYLARIADAAEKTARRVFWVALPVYVGLAAMALWLLSSLMRAATGP